jgi:hypothetical protein
MSELNRQITAALWSLREDAHHARDLMLAGDTSGLKLVGDAYKTLEKLVIQLDTERNGTNAGRH